MRIFLLALYLSFIALNAGELVVGSSLDALNEFKFETPQGQEVKIPKKSKLVIVAFEKDAAALVNEFLATKEPSYLTKNSSTFIADVHEMPAIIAKMFALPKLKKYKHPIYLYDGENFHTVVSSKKAKVTLLEVDNGVIKSISYISTRQELQLAIEN